VWPDTFYSFSILFLAFKSFSPLLRIKTAPGVGPVVYVFFSSNPEILVRCGTILRSSFFFFFSDLCDFFSHSSHLRSLFMIHHFRHHGLRRRSRRLQSNLPCFSPRLQLDPGRLIFPPARSTCLQVFAAMPRFSFESMKCHSPSAKLRNPSVGFIFRRLFLLIRAPNISPLWCLGSFFSSYFHRSNQAPVFEPF